MAKYLKVSYRKIYTFWHPPTDILNVDRKTKVIWGKIELDP